MCLRIVSLAMAYYLNKRQPSHKSFSQMPSSMLDTQTTVVGGVLSELMSPEGRVTEPQSYEDSQGRLKLL